MAILRGMSDTIEVNAKAEISGDLNKVHKLSYKVTFKRRTVDEAQEALAGISDPSSDVTSQAIIREDIVGWRDLQGEGGEVEFNEENLEAMLQHYEYLNSLFEAWGVAQMGRIIANAKN